MSLQYFLKVIRSRMWLILLTALVAVGAGIFFTLSQPQRYASTTSLLINYGADNPFDDERLPAQLADSHLATQVDIIRSRHVALRVVEQLGMASDPDSADSTATRLLRNLDVEPARESRLVQITFESNSSAQSARVANAFAEAYLATTQELAVAPANRNAALLDVQLDRMRERVAEAQSRLTTFQQQKGIVALDERLDTETTRLNELTNQLVEAQARTYDVRSRQLGVNHPEYVRAVQSEQALQRSLDAQKRSLLEVKQQRDELEVLARELRVEEDAYEAALQNYYAAQLHSQFAQPSVDILDPAVPSLLPSSPDIVLSIAGSLVLGLILGIVLGVGAELVFRKIRSDEDIEQTLGVELLGKL